MKLVNTAYGAPHRYLVVILLLLLTGCVTNRVQEYPKDWAAREHQYVGACPAISGNYLNAGQFGEDQNSIAACKPMKYGHGKGELDCSNALLHNFGISWSSSPYSVEIQQPDDDTLIIVPTWRGGGEPSRFELKRSRGKFSCSKDGISFSAIDSAFPGMLATVGIAATHLTVVADGHKRSLLRAEDGSLVMTVESYSRGLLLLVPISFSDTYYVMWLPETSKDTPTPSEHRSPPVSQLGDQ